MSGPAFAAASVVCALSAHWNRVHFDLATEHGHDCWATWFAWVALISLTGAVVFAAVAVIAVFR